MIEVLRAAAELETFCREQRWSHCFIGGLALLRWGEVRFTRDADATIFTGFGDEHRYIQLLLDRFEARVDRAADFALESRTLLLRTRSNVGVDIALGALPYEKEMIGRASVCTLASDILLTVCSAEDLVITKVFAGRTQDWADVEKILIREKGRLEWPLIERELKPLLEAKGTGDSLDRLLGLRDEEAG